MPIGYGYGPGSTSMGTYNWGFGSGAPQSGAGGSGGGNIGQWEQWGEAMQGHLGFGGSMGGDAYNQYLLEQQDPFNNPVQDPPWSPPEQDPLFPPVPIPDIDLTHDWTFDPTNLTGITPLFGEGFNPFDLTNTSNVPPPNPEDMAFGTTGMDLSGVNIGMQGLNPGDAGYMTQDEYFDHINPQIDWLDFQEEGVGYDPELIGEILEGNEEAYLQNFANTLMNQGGLDPQYFEQGLYGTDFDWDTPIGQETLQMVEEGSMNPFELSQWLQQQYIDEGASDVLEQDYSGQFGSDILPDDLGFDVSSVPPAILNNLQRMLNSGATAAQIQSYLSEMGGQYKGIGELQDWLGGGGEGGTAAKKLFYPDQQTGFAGVGEGISNKQKVKPMQSTLDQLLKTQGQR